MQSQAHPRLLLTIRDAANLLSLSYPTMHRLLIRGEIPSIKIGASRRVSPEALKAYIHRLEGTANDETGQARGVDQPPS